MDLDFAPRIEWESWAFCIGYPRKWFFAEPGQGRFYNRRAKELCAQCPVQRNCLNYAIVHNEQGIWGGLTEKERKQLPVVVLEYVRDNYRELDIIEDRRVPRIFSQSVLMLVEPPVE